MREDGAKLTLPGEPNQESPELLEALLRLCADRVESGSPSRGLALCRATVPLAPLLGNRCQVVQAYGIMSDGERSLGFLPKAHQTVRFASSIADDCMSCSSALHWREGLILRDECRFDYAISKFDAALDLQYRATIDHDLHGNSIAKILLGRGSTYYEAGLKDPMNRFSLISSAVGDISRALSLILPAKSNKLYRGAILNLSCALSATGRRSDLLMADRYVRDARQLFKGVQTCSQERTKLEWLTAMIRYELRSMKLHRVCECLTRAQEDFISMGMRLEAVAIAADLARLAFPDQNRIRDYIGTMESKIFHISLELRQRLRTVIAATKLKDWDAPKALRTAIVELREACGPKMLACLISWPPIDSYE